MTISSSCRYAELRLKCYAVRRRTVAYFTDMASPVTSRGLLKPRNGTHVRHALVLASAWLLDACAEPTDVLYSF